MSRARPVALLLLLVLVSGGCIKPALHSDNLAPSTGNDARSTIVAV